MKFIIHLNYFDHLFNIIKVNLLLSKLITNQLIIKLVLIIITKNKARTVIIIIIYTQYNTVP